MFIDLHKALERIEENLPRDRKITFEMLEKAYQQTLWLRSHILGVMYDMMEFGSATKRSIGEVSASLTDSGRVVCLMIPEPLPGLKGADRYLGRTLGPDDPRSHRPAGKNRHPAL